MGKMLNRVGEMYKSFQGYEMEIIEYFSAMDITIKFNDERNTIKKNVAFKEVKNGAIKNPYHRNTLGIGYTGEGDFKPKVNGKMSKEYRIWDGMMRRCYSPHSNRLEAYKNVTVCEEWHNFQNFAKWYEENYDSSYMEGWCIDKDIICYECKEYSPENCCIVPNAVNVLFSKNNQNTFGLPKGVHPKDGKYQSSISKFRKQCYLGFFNTVEEAHLTYCKAKKEYIKEVADKWKGKISDKVYEAMINFNISNL